MTSGGVRLIGLGAAIAAVAGLVLWAQGHHTFVTHPVAVLSLSAAAVIVAKSGKNLSALAASLVLYSLLGSWATVAPDSLSAGLWSAGWIPINALLACIGLVAAGRNRLSWALLGLSAVAVITGAFLVRPVAPFQGIATAAPDGWENTAPLFVEVVLGLWQIALLGVTVMVFLDAKRASISDRRRLARAAAVTSCAPCLVIVCLALAVLRDPGDIDPTTGSVAYTCAIGLLSVVAARTVSGDEQMTVRVVAGIWAAALVVLLGVAVIGPVAQDNLTVAVIGVAVTTVGVVLVLPRALARFENWSRPPVPRVVDRTVPQLSPRENDVLAAVARGGTNGAVAAELFLSERTVEQHLRSIFDKLDLGEHGTSNRRVRAAALWWQAQGAAEEAS